jgi:hypothetical protein
MDLQPSEPPGHAKRKLRGYVSEIARLRADGYTIRAVHQALIEAGVVVSWATVQREAARPTRSTRTKTPEHSSLPKTSPSTPAIKPPPLGRGKKAVADDIDAYFTQHNNNPLFKKKAR